MFFFFFFPLLWQLFSVSTLCSCFGGEGLRGVGKKLYTFESWNIVTMPTPAKENVEQHLIIVIIGLKEYLSTPWKCSPRCSDVQVYTWDLVTSLLGMVTGAAKHTPPDHTLPQPSMMLRVLVSGSEVKQTWNFQTDLAVNCCFSAWC